MSTRTALLFPSRWRGGLLALAMVALCIVPSMRAEAGRGRLRVEADVANTIDTDAKSYDGDLYGTVCLEYEWPLFARVGLGIQGYPLFAYRADIDHDTIYGLAAGLALRVYQHKGSLSGLYAEAGTAALVTNKRFAASDSDLNFLSQLGVGYQFKMVGLNLSLKYQHLSNAGISDYNPGVDAVAVGVGYRF